MTSSHLLHDPQPAPHEPTSPLQPDPLPVAGVGPVRRQRGPQHTHRSSEVPGRGGRELVTLADVVARVKRGPRWVMRAVKAGTFPAPLPQFGRPVWLAAVIEAWVDGAWGQSRFFGSARGRR